MKPLTQSLFLLTSLFSFLSFNVAATESELDMSLAKYIEALKFGTPAPSASKRPEFYALGKALFESPLLSGERNISCASCHQSDLGSADGLPLGLGVGATHGVGARQSEASQLLKRHTPAIFNLSNETEFLFWDGRVRFQKKFWSYSTPTQELNGDYPEAWEIAEVLEGALSAQALFPIIDEFEMMGSGNEVSRQKTDLLKWKKVTERVMKDEKLAELVKKAFIDSGEWNKEEINIAHLANAMAEYETFKFMANNSPWDQYLAGDKDALSIQEKQGAIAFVKKGFCATCHKGPMLSDGSFRNIAAPQIGEGFDLHKNDEGRFLITGKEDDRYKFKVPSLRNVALTAPYFHSGVYTSLEEVLDHYTGGTQSLDHYSSDKVEQAYGHHYLERFFVETGPYRLFRKKEDAHILIKGKKIKLTSSERENILLFLRKSLTDKSFLTR